MIKINKREEIPEILENTDDYMSEIEKEILAGVKKLGFNQDIYRHTDVKKALMEDQYDKCAFCESKFSHISFGDVEHFRPKSATRQRVKDKLERPGYFWLVYDWHNLYVSCEICNRRFKRNMFPLVDDSSRVRVRGQGLEAEEPLLVDPGKEDPRQFIEFNAEVPKPVAGSRKGRKTIQTLGLDRKELCDERLKVYNSLKHNNNILQLDRILEAARGMMKDLTDMHPGVEELSKTLAPQWNDIVKEARLFVESSIEDQSEYSGMARCAIENGFG